MLREAMHISLSWFTMECRRVKKALSPQMIFSGDIWHLYSHIFLSYKEGNSNGGVEQQTSPLVTPLVALATFIHQIYGYRNTRDI
jgi:hypothetical protein